MLNLFKKKPGTAPDLPESSNTLKHHIFKIRARFSQQLSDVLSFGRHIEDSIYEDLEAVLLTADIGAKATTQLLDHVRQQAARHQLRDASELKQALKQALLEMILPLQQPLIIQNHQPYVIMLLGVNGAGKTTSLGKLALLLQTQGKSVLIAAGDTFRAAAREQLSVWGERNQVRVVQSVGNDPAAVIYDAIESAKANRVDVVLADTAGRLPTQNNLMEELKKIKRVMHKAAPGAPHEVLLVLDANTGQNGVTQVQTFDAAVGLTGLIVSKLDGTAKGGIIAAISSYKAIPVRYIGVGEKITDLQEFIAEEFVEAIFS